MILNNSKIDVLGIKTEASIPQKTEEFLQGVIKPKPGQKVFEIHLITGKISEAESYAAAIHFGRAYKGDISHSARVKTKPGYIYIPAINKANALAKFRKNKSQSAYYAPEPVFKIDDLKIGMYIMQSNLPYTGTYEVGGKILELSWNIHKEAGQDLVLIGFDKYNNRYMGTAQKEGNGIKNVRFIKN